ncbi:hypothetical protein HKX48_000751 [Thoreauomyces humboldtii]|nr:hypothetical protein HKX48_000751 [Thoreauomyces humboldtii]
MLQDTRRIEREIRQVHADKSAQLSVRIVDDNIHHLLATIQGPSGSPYESGTFTVDIVLSDQYPFKPPAMKFVTSIYHPNVSSQTGAICLSILKDEWSPVLTIKTVLISLQSLLCDAAPDNPQDAEVAGHYLRDRADFNRTARQWTEIHAGGASASEPAPAIQSTTAPPPTSAGASAEARRQAAQQSASAASASMPQPAISVPKDPAVARLVEMGFPQDLVIRALDQSDADEGRALEALLADNVM